MPYEYIFDKEICWYKTTCPKYTKNQCKKTCVRYFEMHYLMGNSGLPLCQQLPKELYPQKEDLPAFHQLREIKENIKSFVKNGKNLYIYSNNTGNGKTTWAVKILLKYFDEIWYGNRRKVRGLFINVPWFLIKLKQNIGLKDPDFILLQEHLYEVDLVVWDDISALEGGNYDLSNLLAYIDSRIFKGKSNIFTGNIQEEKMIEILGQRLTSRIWDNSQKIELVGADRRGING